MSGPKTARYILTPAQKRRLEEEQRIRRKTRAAQDRRNSILYKARSSLLDFEEVIPELEMLCEESKKGIVELQEVKKSCGDMSAVLKNELYQADGLALESLIEQIESLDKIISEIRIMQRKAKELIQQNRSEYQSELEAVIAAGFEIEFTALGTDRKTRSNPFLKKIDEALGKVADYDLPDFLLDRLKVLQERAAKITGTDFLENFCSMQVYPFVAECERYRERGEEYEQLLLEYRMLANETGEEPKRYEFSEQAIDDLKKDIAKLEKEIMFAEEQEYISEAIDDALEEMGYELVGDRNVVKKSGKRFRNELYLFDEGTAVNVTFADNGQISMELGALDVTDRAPTETEAADLANDMKEFCAEYADLKNRLVQKGIMVNNISLLPPEPEYAQIINTADYEMKTDTGIYQQEREKRKKYSDKRQQKHKEG